MNVLSVQKQAKIVAAPPVEGNSIRSTVRMTGVPKNAIPRLMAKLGPARIQLATDGHRVYAEAVESAFGSEIDYAMLIKVYGADRVENEARYSPAGYMGCRTIPMSGNPKSNDISTSFVERPNLTMRMQMRRFTRRTNAFSKKVENLGWAVSLHFMHYNFCRVHQTLRVTPAMEAGIADHVWTLEEVVGLLQENVQNAA